MLQLAGVDFTTGVLNYRDESDVAARPHASIYIPVNFLLSNGLTIAHLAMIDTGAPWVVIGPDLIAALGLTPEVGSTMTMDTRLGPKEGFLASVDVVIPAEDGESLKVQSTVFACHEWNQGVFLGYSGCMSRMNFALQPQGNKFYFGLLS